jgi:hypothetical protein
MSMVVLLLPLAPVAARESPAAPTEMPTPTRTFVSTSGIPHGDVADYRKSPMWKPGMPVGANARWRTYMAEIVNQITASNPDAVLHGGDMVEGRWYGYVDNTFVFGPRGTPWRDRQVVRRAGNTIYPWIKRWWAGHTMLWGQGDHEVGDMAGNGRIPATTFSWEAHRHWNDVWKRHFGKIRHSRRFGNVGIITLDPFVRWKTGIYPVITARDQRWITDRVQRWRANGVDWIFVQSEIPAVGPNRERGTSALLLRNGDRIWSLLDDLGVDLLLAAEFHTPTTRSRSGRTPVQIVHGGRHMRASWLQIDVHGSQRLELTLRQSNARGAGRGTIWAMSRARLNDGPIAGTPKVIGTATITAARRIRNRTGFLREGIR